MAEDNGELWKHIGDLHRKHSELAIQMHDRGNGNDEQLHGHLQGIHETLKEILQALKSKGDEHDRRAGAGKTKGAGETGGKA